MFNYMKLLFSSFRTKIKMCLSVWSHQKKKNIESVKLNQHKKINLKTFIYFLNQSKSKINI